MRLFWVLTHVALDDPEHGDETQKLGIVGLVANGMDSMSRDAAFSECFNHSHMYGVFYSDLLTCLPLKICGMHMVAPNPFVKLLIEKVLSYMGPEVRARCKFYDGTTEENLRKIEDFGITEDMVPPELGGTLEFNYHAFLKAKEEQDRQRYCS